MIRVLYRWRVASDVADDFPAWWHEGTELIRTTYRGSLGSTLLRSREDSSIFVGVARWESTEALQAFWQVAGSTSFSGAELEGTDLFEELDDLTIPER